jgi:Carbohydrate esterase, sialic acid-specific acetylesterase
LSIIQKNRHDPDVRRTWLGTSIAIMIALSVFLVARRSAIPDLLFLNTRIISVEEPSEGAVLQRAGTSPTDVFVSGRVGWFARSVEVAAASGDVDSISPSAWTMLDPKPRMTRFRGRIRLKPGWTKLSFRSKGAGYRQGDDVMIGVGEVFVIAGQSNAAGSSKTLFLTDSANVMAGRIDKTRLTWRRGDDPQLSGTGGSVWPLVGKTLAAELGVPIGFINVAVGGSSLQDWKPGGQLQSTLVKALRLTGSGGARAVLWHQGESNKNTPPAEYRDGLARLITQTRSEVGGKPVPWVVAEATYSFGSSGDGVRAAQVSLWKNGMAFPGPDTDVLGTRYRESDDVHFNDLGTREAAKLWAKALEAAFFPDPSLKSVVPAQAPRISDRAAIIR